MKTLKRIIRENTKPGTLRWKVLSARDDLLCRYMSYGGFLKYLFSGKAPRLRPRSLHIVLGQDCNQRCKMCFQDNFNSRIDPDIYKNILLPVYKGVNDVLIAGGEPTILPETREFIDIVKKENPCARFSTITNGKAFDRSWIDEFVSRGSSVKFSLNAVSKETYEKIVEGGDWDGVILNLKRLVECRNNDRKSGLRILASFVIIKENAHEASAFPEFCRKLGVDEWHFNIDKRERASLSGNPEAGSRPARAESVRPVNYSSGDNTRKCYAPYTNIYIDVSGNARVCCFSDKVIGNIRESPIDELMNNEKAEAMRKRVTEERDYSHCDSNCAFIVNDLKLKTASPCGKASRR